MPNPTAPNKQNSSKSPSVETPKTAHDTKLQQGALNAHNSFQSAINRVGSNNAQQAEAMVGAIVQQTDQIAEQLANVLIAANSGHLVITRAIQIAQEKQPDFSAGYAPGKPFEIAIDIPDPLDGLPVYPALSSGIAR